MAITNVFAAEPLVIARIRDQVPDLLTVASASMLASDPDIAPLCPAAFVLPGQGGEGPNEKGATHKVMIQEWQVIVCVKHLNEHDETISAAYEAGKYIWQICGALMAWRPVPDPAAPTDFKPFIWAGQSGPEYTVGFAMFPIFFNTEIILKAA